MTEPVAQDMRQALIDEGFDLSVVPPVKRDDDCYYLYFSGLYDNARFISITHNLTKKSIPALVKNADDIHRAMKELPEFKRLLMKD